MNSKMCYVLIAVVCELNTVKVTEAREVNLCT